MSCGSVLPMAVVVFGEASGGDKYSNFDLLNNLEKTSYVLSSELWEDDFSSLREGVSSRCVGVIW